jgi:hypothetical protein
VIGHFLFNKAFVVMHEIHTNEVHFISYFADAPKPQRERRTRDRGKNEM